MTLTRPLHGLPSPACGRGAWLCLHSRLRLQQPSRFDELVSLPLNRSYRTVTVIGNPAFENENGRFLIVMF